jgi:hypothetical protein
VALFRVMAAFFGLPAVASLVLLLTGVIWEWTAPTRMTCSSGVGRERGCNDLDVLMARSAWIFGMVLFAGLSLMFLALARSRRGEATRARRLRTIRLSSAGDHGESDR